MENSVALEATLNIAARAIANADHEFGLELCKKASAVIYDPRLCSIMGECYELKGDALEAIAAYRAALTMDTTLSGRPLPTEANQRAQERLQYLVRKAGLGNSWTNVHRQNAQVTPALIEQQLRANRIGDAVSTYKRSDEYKKRNKPRFHVEVGRAFKEHSVLRDKAAEAFGIAIACEDGGAAALHEMGDLMYESRKYDDALNWYSKALAIEPKHALSRSGMANCEKDKGNLDAAISHYKMAVDASPGDPTFVFNLAQAYEYTQQFEEAVAVLQQYSSTLKKPADMTTVNHFAVPLLELKLCFVGGFQYHKHIRALLDEIATFPEVATKAVQALSTHWAYYFFLSRLTVGKVPGLLETRGAPEEMGEPLYFVGDSHVLSCAWCPLQVAGHRRYIHPLLVTGLKAWHLRHGHRFLTVSTTHRCMQSLPKGTTEIVFVCGEIDCREGLPGALAKKKYADMQAAVDATVAIYAAALHELASTYDVAIKVLTVTPPCNPKYADRITATRLFNHKLREIYGAGAPQNCLLDIAADVSELGGTVKTQYNCDGTHMNSCILPLLQRELDSVFRPS